MARTIDERLRRDIFRGSLALADGAVTRHELRSARFVRLVRDVYAVADTPVTHELRCRAAMMIVSPTAVLTGRSAATVRGIALANPWDPVELAVPEDDRFGPIRGLRIRRVESSPLSGVHHEDLRLASPERMCFDLAIRRNLYEAVADLDQVLHQGAAEPAALQAYLAALHERDVRRARHAVDLADGRAESRPESRVRVLLALNGLRPVPQVEIWDEYGFVARVDLGFEGQRVAVEYDGVWHADGHQLSRDRERLNRLRRARWQVVFVTAEMLRNDPRGVVTDVRSALLRQA